MTGGRAAAAGREKDTKESIKCGRACNKLGSGAGDLDERHVAGASVLQWHFYAPDPDQDCSTLGCICCKYCVLHKAGPGGAAGRWMGGVLGRGGFCD